MVRILLSMGLVAGRKSAGGIGIMHDLCCGWVGVVERRSLG